jgi:hypothetical protein
LLIKTRVSDNLSNYIVPVRKTTQDAKTTRLGAVDYWKRIHMMQKIVVRPFYGLLILMLGLSQLSAPPASADELMNITDVKDCQKISGDAERLSCYDTVSRGGIFNEQKLKEVQVEQFGSKQLRKPPEAAPPEAAKPVKPVASEATTETKSSPPPQTKISVDQIQVTVVRMRKDGTGHHYFQTSDNQVWKQEEGRRWTIAAPFEARIEKGMMGSFFLVSESGKSTRVKRVK